MKNLNPAYFPQPAGSLPERMKRLWKGRKERHLCQGNKILLSSMGKGLSRQEVHVGEAEILEAESKVERVL